ncbi:DUF6770 family protein [Lewinella sp. JB7]|uniref:DUF6770 family protein n=1 Tax=Lewinella sp. JB7 TaxID=2962887 RepID=UPI0020C9EAB6|nr:DUF6770 family protein [Lewinella sp. JB7]MCP9234343.1 hypothetical protein [Lewinella sp. JB7]
MTTRTILFFIFCSIFLSTSRLSAQRASFAEVESTYFNKSGVLETAGEIVGYYLLNYHKTGTDQGFYTIQLMDQDLNKIGEQDLDDYGDITVIDVAYNGTNLGVLVVNHDQEKKWLIVLDGDGQFVKKTALPYSMYDTREYEAFNNPIKVNLYGIRPLIPTPEGFLHVGLNAKKKFITSGGHYLLTMVPNAAEERGWRSSSRDKKIHTEGAIYLGSNDEFLLMGIFSKSAFPAKKHDMKVVGFDLATGRRLFSYAPEKGEPMIRFMGGKAAGDDVVVYGYDVGKKPALFTESPENIHALRFSATGKLKKGQSISVADVMRSEFDVKKSGKVSEYGNLMLHDLAVTPEGGLILAGEFYRVMNIYVKTNAGVLISLYPDMSLEKVDIVEKGSSSGSAFGVSGFMLGVPKAALMGNYANARGIFDFNFLHDNRGTIIATYELGRGEDKREASHGVQVCVYLDGDIMQERIDFATTTDKAIVLPAKEGYLAIIEYDGDSQALDVHMERLTF